MRKHISQSLKSTLLLAILLASCVAPTTPAPTVTPEPITFKLKWHHGVQFLGFYVAQSRGYYAEESLAVTIEPLFDSTETSELLERIAAGKYDFGIGALWMERAQSVPITAIATLYQFGPEVLFARADSGVVTPADLAGRRVVVKSTNWQKLIEELLAHEGLTLDDVEAVPGGFDMTPFFESEVEVWAGFIHNEVVRARNQGLNIVTLPLYEYGISTSAVTIFTSQAMLKAGPDRAVRFLRASLRGWEWAAENPAEAVDIMLELFPEMAAERDFHLASFEASIPLIIPGGTRIGSIDCQTTQFQEQRLPEAFCTTEILERVWEGE